MTESQRTDLRYARQQLARAQRYNADGRLTAAADSLQRACDALERIEAEAAQPVEMGD